MNFGFITGSTYLGAGEYSFGWSYAAQDYAPFDDGVFFSIVGGGVSSISVLASNFTGQADTVIVGAYGSTRWRLTTFTIATAGIYQLGFGGYNHTDDEADPILYLDNGLGGLTANGVVVAPATPVDPVIDGQQAAYVISNVSAGLVQPIFDGGTLLVDAAGTYSNDFTINGQGGTIDSGGLDATLDGDIGGAGGLTKTGEGALILTGANTYSGGTAVTGGQLVVGSSQALGGASGGPITLGGTGSLVVGTDLTLTSH